MSHCRDLACSPSRDPYDLATPRRDTAALPRPAGPAGPATQHRATFRPPDELLHLCVNGTTSGVMIMSGITKESEEVLTRTHVTLPRGLIDEVDRVAGVRGRSRFVERAIRELLRRERLSSVLWETAGALEHKGYPEWDTPEKVSTWVRERRKEDGARLARKLGPVRK